MPVAAAAGGAVIMLDPDPRFPLFRMLAYRHQFHAGNFADVFKHALLAQLVLALAKKDKPFFCAHSCMRS